MNRRIWQTTVHGVTEGWTRLKPLSAQCTYVVFKHYHWFSDSKITMNIENLATDANNFWGKHLKGLGTISQFNMQYFGVFFFSRIHLSS